MGLIVSIKCEKCGNTIDLRTGCGLRDHDLNRVIVYFSEDNQRVIREAISKYENEKQRQWEFRRMIARCDSSGKIKSLPTFHVIKAGEADLVAWECNCGGTHYFYSEANLSDRTETCQCPECGAQMTYGEIGHWD